MKKTDILEVVSRKLAPFILLFGFYLLTYGHLSPGGGFQGGVTMASGIILMFLANRTSQVLEIFPMRAIHYTEAFGLLAFLLTGIAGLILEKGFLSNFLNVPGIGAIQGGGTILILNVIIGLKVGAGITLICYYLFREKEKE
ncbi:MAG: MnhB domain-containing protein [Spirochaetia bacterium]|jgi:multicomponent Na+:H+ antiporter subunit B|nr:MnhB domain-containing protein [Spirochaetia bacterium]